MIAPAFAAICQCYLGAPIYRDLPRRVPSRRYLVFFQQPHVRKRRVGKVANGLRTAEAQIRTLMSDLVRD